MSGLEEIPVSFGKEMGGVLEQEVHDRVVVLPLEHARLLLTDSGGLQEESTYFRTPCLTLRPNTERPVTVTVGSNRLTTLGGFMADALQALSGPERLGQIPPLWDGHAAERTIDHLLAAQTSPEKHAR